MKLYTKLFKDGNNTYAGFNWWIRWNFAAWCWRRWLIYEGMPNKIKTVEEMQDWNSELIKRQWKL